MKGNLVHSLAFRNIEALELEYHLSICWLEKIVKSLFWMRLLSFHTLVLFPPKVNMKCFDLISLILPVNLFCLVLEKTCSFYRMLNLKSSLYPPFYVDAIF